jgi:hypothetical protein
MDSLALVVRFVFGPFGTSLNLRCWIGVLHEESTSSGNAVMGRAANDNWPKRQLLVVPHAARGNRLSTHLQAEAQDRIGSALLAMYADLLQQPCPRDW